ncbi:hypothetical protein OAL34_00515 [Synechococcus sp. AH-551-G03]|nr:hypothetical protein [Synechococcus sp. AH-551-G03]
MAIPCIVIDQNFEVIETTISGLSNHLKVSIAMSSPLVKKYSQLSLQNSSEKAMQQMLMSHMNELDEFCLMWDEARKDVANGAMATMDDLVDAISTAKKGFFESPRRILVVQINEKDCDILLVGKPVYDELWEID